MLVGIGILLLLINKYKLTENRSLTILRSLSLSLPFIT